MALPWRGKDLHFDVARRVDVSFDQDARVAEGRLRLALGGFEGRVEVSVVLGTPHALTAAARHRLDQHRIANFVGLLLEEFRVLPHAVIARHHRHAGLLHQRLGAILQAHGADRLRPRPNKDDTDVDAGLCEVGVLG